MKSRNCGAQLNAAMRLPFEDLYAFGEFNRGAIRWRHRRPALSLSKHVNISPSYRFP